MTPAQRELFKQAVFRFEPLPADWPADFAVITAYDPDGVATSPDLNLTADAALESVIGFIMLALLFTLAIDPKRWKRLSAIRRPLPAYLRHVLYVGVGFYGGFVQMGIGLVLLAALVLAEHWSLRDGNTIKLLLAFVVVVPAFFLFFWLGEIHWLPGGLLALGSASGASLAARYWVRDPRWQPVVRGVLMLALAVGAWRTLSPYLW
jgi:uncharacterized membrane protein YfcA